MTNIKKEYLKLHNKELLILQEDVLLKTLHFIRQGEPGKALKMFEKGNKIIDDNIIIKEEKYREYFEKGSGI